MSTMNFGSIHQKFRDLQFNLHQNGYVSIRIPPSFVPSSQLLDARRHDLVRRGSLKPITETGKRPPETEKGRGGGWNEKEPSPGGEEEGRVDSHNYRRLPQRNWPQLR